MSDDSLRPEIARAGLPLVVLALLSTTAGHGYVLLERLRDHGFERIQGGTLYPLLRRLEERDLVTHVWIHDSTGPGRKEFAITSAGERELKGALEDWRRIGEVLTDAQRP